MFEWLHRRWLKNELRKEGKVDERGEAEVLQTVYESLSKYYEDNEPTRISYFIAMAIRIARKNSEFCDDEQIRLLVKDALADRTLTSLGAEAPVKESTEPQLLKTLESAYARFSDVGCNWPGRMTQSGQTLLCDMRDAIADSKPKPKLQPRHNR